MIIGKDYNVLYLLLISGRKIKLDFRSQCTNQYFTIF